MMSKTGIVLHWLIVNFFFKTNFLLKNILFKFLLICNENKILNLDKTYSSKEKKAIKLY